jgi:putative aldouronate transport system substrate-binding protein
MGIHFDIREDIMTELGYSEIKTKEQFIEFLYKAKEAHPEMVILVPGVNVELYTSWAYVWFRGSKATDYIKCTSLNTASLMLYYKDREPVVHNFFDEPDKLVMDAIYEARQLYLDGIIDPDIMSLNSQRNEIANGRAISTSWAQVYVDPTVRINVQNNFNTDIKTFIPFEEEYFTPGSNDSDFKAWNFQSLCVVSKNKDRAIMLLEASQFKPSYDFMAFGIPGKHSILHGDDRWELIDSQFRRCAYLWIMDSINDRVISTMSDEDLAREMWLRKAPSTDFLFSPEGYVKFNPTSIEAEVAQYLAIEQKYLPGICNGFLDPDKALAEFKAEAYDILKVIQIESQKQLDQGMAEASFKVD